MADSRPLYVTRPALPPLDELRPLLENIWESRILSNYGPYHHQLEIALAKYLGVEHVCLVSNATLGLILALRKCELQGEVITTPFSFVGTSHAIQLAGLTPVFVDIDPDSLNLDPAKIEAAITPRTRAIMPVHIFGRACNVAAINSLARKHNLKVIYDAAHAFGIADAGGSLLRHGDMSILSFHATKVFNTFEGGAVICPDAETRNAINNLRNFGIVDELTVTSVGMNAKMHEFSAALGLLQLRYIDDCIARRGDADDRYRQMLADVPGVTCLPAPPNQTLNYYNFPILIDRHASFSRDDLYNRLQLNGVYARRYFYPLISDLPMYAHLPSARAAGLPVAQDISSRVLCLPLFPDLRADEQERIVGIISEQHVHAG